MSLTLDQLTQVFQPFLDRLVNDHGNDRQEMINYHLTKLVGLPIEQVLRKMPRGPKNRWGDMMLDIREQLKHMG